MQDSNGQTIQLERVGSEKDLGVIIDKDLKFSDHITSITVKALRVLFTIKRTIITRNSEVILKLYKALVRPLLEYAQVVWQPRLLQDCHKIERVQRLATKLITNVRNLPYNERLRALKLPSLQHRRKRGDMIMLYQCSHNMVKCNIPLYQFAHQRITRGHKYKMAIQRSEKNVRKNFFTHRAAPVWNSLPEETVNAKTVNIFKRKLDNHWTDSPEKYDYY